ncbi:hypothetical protein [uncultured Shewanella sp.]|uniref:hypothetical protein n=1 Tax=Shewanella atlantica TaxID=271099 RepID=UPI002632A8DD|nr:hypothetical protein [uncultured Shewanella sp.]
MARFTISRLDTTQGTFRLTGEWTRPGDDHTRTNSDLTIHTLDIMGTDGWLGLKPERNATLIDTLKAEIKSHLRAKRQKSG